MATAPNRLARERLPLNNRRASRSTRASSLRPPARSAAISVERLEDRVLFTTQPFLPREFYQVQFTPRLITTGDLNGDGFPDIVAPIPEENVVVALMNNGDGSFSPRRTFVRFQTARAVAVADFNGDGKADLAVSGTNANGSNVVAIYFGNGDGTFNQTPVEYGIGSAGLAITTADVNHDGFPDLVVTTGRRIAVLINNGNGTFQKPVYYNVGGPNNISDQPFSVAVGDFNHDGLPDIATCLSATGTVSVLMNDPANPGTFLPPQVYSVQGNPLAITTGDFNGDGNLDLAVIGSGFKVRAINILLGNGNGTFGPAITYNGPYFADAIAAGTFTSSGHEDLIVGSFDGPLEYFQGNGDGTFATPVNIPGALFVQDVQVADFNGDGLADIAVPSAGIKVYLNAGNSTPSTPGGPSQVAIGSGSAGSASFFAIDGTRTTVSLHGPGSATIDFAGSSQISVPSGAKLATVTGEQVAGIILSGTSAATTLSISTRNRSQTLTLPSITADSQVGAIDAPSTNLTGDISLPQGLGRLTFGSANGGTITIGAGGAPVLAFGEVGNETIDSSASIAAIRVALDAGINLTAPSLNTLLVGGSLHDSTLSLTAAYAAGVLDLGTVNSVRAMSNVVISSAGNVGTVAALEMTNDSIDAGVGTLAAGQTFPGLGDFVATASVRAVRLQQPLLSQSFSNSFISAYQIDSLALGTIQIANNGSPFGVTSHSVTALSGSVIQGQNFVLRNLNSAAAVQTQVSAKRLNLGDFQVNIV